MSQTVAPGVSKKANDLVVTHLAIYGGQTAEQVMEVTGLSKSQVHRVMRSNSLVTSRQGKGKAKIYSVDTEKLATITTLPVAVEHKVEFDHRADELLAQLADMPLADQALNLKSMLEGCAERVELLVKAQHMSEALQGGHIDDQQAALYKWADILTKLEKVKVAGMTLSRFLDNYIDSPAARTPEWWTLFPKGETKDEDIR